MQCSHTREYFSLQQPFRCIRASYELGDDGVTPVQHRRVWTDGTHVVAQAAFVSKGQQMAVKIFQVHPVSLVVRVWLCAPHPLMNQVTIKPKATGVSLHYLGNVLLGAHAVPDYTYLMNVFFAKTFFILDFSESSLRSSVLHRVELHNRTSTAAVKIPGWSLGGFSASGEERMPSVGEECQQWLRLRDFCDCLTGCLLYFLAAFHNWNTFVLRKFPDEKLPENRSRMFIYSHKLELVCVFASFRLLSSVITASHSQLHQYGPPMGDNWR